MGEADRNQIITEAYVKEVTRTVYPSVSAPSISLLGFGFPSRLRNEGLVGKPKQSKTHVWACISHLNDGDNEFPPPRNVERIE